MTLTKTESRYDTRSEVVDLIPALRAFARTFTLDVTEADDLVQETLYRALRSLEQFRPGTSLKSWLFTIMRNTFCTQYKVKVRESPASESCASLSLSVAAPQEWAVAGDEFQSAYSKLSTEHREILFMVAAMGFSYEEAAQTLDCSVGTVKSRLNRARGSLASLMDGHPLRP